MTGHSNRSTHTISRRENTSSIVSSCISGGSGGGGGVGRGDSADEHFLSTPDSPDTSIGCVSHHNHHHNNHHLQQQHHHQKVSLASPSRSGTPTPTILTSATDITCSSSKLSPKKIKKRNGSSISQKRIDNKEAPERRQQKCPCCCYWWCWVGAAVLLAIVAACAAAGIFAAEYLFGDKFGIEQRESHEQRLRMVTILLRETPLIGK